MGEGQLEVTQVGEEAVAVLGLLEEEVVGIEGRGEDQRDGLEEGLSCFEVPVDGCQCVEVIKSKMRNTDMVLHARNSGRNGGSSSLGCL